MHFVHHANALHFVQSVMDPVAADVGAADAARHHRVHRAIQRVLRRANAIRRTLQFFMFTTHPRIRMRPWQIARDVVSPLFQTVDDEDSVDDEQFWGPPNADDDPIEEFE